MPDYEDLNLQKRVHAGAKKLVNRCHCGKIRARHTISEARNCMKDLETSTVVTQMSEKDINQMEPRRI